MSKHTADTAAAVISPMVLTQLGVTFDRTLLAAFLALLTPETLQALGPFAVPVATAAVAASGYLAGYLKTDPLRNVGAAVADIGEANVPVPIIESESVGTNDTLTTEADALATRAAQLHRTGSTAGGVL